jgi:hypothetical protein
VALQYEIRGGRLVWIRNPFTGVISYVVDLRAKSFAFTLGARESAQPATSAAAIPDEEEIKMVLAACPFCPGNERRAPPELFRVGHERIPDWNGGNGAAPWLIRAFNNLFPRIPQELTGDRNESYVVVEDPRHFVEHPRSLDDLLFTAALSEEHFVQLIAADAEVMRIALGNDAVRSVAVRKNQGRESGASQPHVHQQIIGSPVPLPAIDVEAAATREAPQLWDEMVALFDDLGLVVERRGAIVSYASPIGVFPRSYDVVMPQYRGLMTELSQAELREFAISLFRIMRVMGPIPLDYEIHQGEGLPLHAHLNSRIYPYSNVAGTLNVPNTLLESSAAIRRALGRR